MNILFLHILPLLPQADIAEWFDQSTAAMFADLRTLAVCSVAQKCVGLLGLHSSQQPSVGLPVPVNVGSR